MPHCQLRILRVLSVLKKRFDRINYVFAHFAGGFRIDRQSQDFAGNCFGYRTISNLAAQIFETFLQVQTQRIVDRAADVVRLQIALEFIALAAFDQNTVLVVDVAGGVRRRLGY